LPVSILKPLKGTDPEMYESLRGHCLQDYPEYEIIFGVNDPTDPSRHLVERLKSEFPQLSIRWMVCAKNLGANIKVSNLTQMLVEAKYDRVLVNDSDIRVPLDYLRRVMAPLADPQVGLVTCLYRGVPGGTLGSRLESIGISTDFSAGVLAARTLEGGIHFGLGSTLAFRRSDLAAIGGFEALVDYLADDYEIGRRMAKRGLRVRLSDVVVETYLPAYAPVCGPSTALGPHRPRLPSLGLSGVGADLRRTLGAVVRVAKPVAESRYSRCLGSSGCGYRLAGGSRNARGMVGCAGSPVAGSTATASTPRCGSLAGLDRQPRRSHSGLARRFFSAEKW
jgi:hypothetical protein